MSASLRRTKLLPDSDARCLSQAVSPCLSLTRGNLPAVGLPGGAGRGEGSQRCLPRAISSCCVSIQCSSHTRGAGTSSRKLVQGSQWLCELPSSLKCPRDNCGCQVRRALWQSARVGNEVRQFSCAACRSQHLTVLVLLFSFRFQQRDQQE